VNTSNKGQYRQIKMGMKPEDYLKAKAALPKKD
jgi:hypothetical protein